MADYYSILGVARNASLAQIKEAYLRLARENHPDRFKDPDERDEAALRFEEISESYNVLRDEKARREYDRSLDRATMTPQQEAELYHKDGYFREQAKDYQEALKRYHEAMRLDPDNVTYVVSAARLTSLDRSKQRQAADLLNRAIAKHPKAREPYLELGALFSRSGLLLRAKRVYEMGLEQVPGDVELRSRLADVTAAAERSRSK